MSILIPSYSFAIASWERWAEEAHEGWGWGMGVEEDAAVVAGEQHEQGEPMKDDVLNLGVGNSTMGALFERNGVVFPIHPTGHMRLPSPKAPFKQTGELAGAVGQQNVTFVIQVRKAGECTAK